MHCQSCEALIEKSVNKLEGINDVKADYATETVEIEQDLFNPVFSPEHEEGFRNRVSILLADIVLNIDRGVNYE